MTDETIANQSRRNVGARSPAKSQRPDLSRLTPVEANHIITQYILTANPSLAPVEFNFTPMLPALPGIPPSWRECVHQRILSAMPKPPTAEPLYAMRTHFLETFDQVADDELKLLGRALMLYARGSIGHVDLTREKIERCGQTFARAWETIDRAKASDNDDVRRAALALEKAVLGYFQRLPGERTYFTDRVKEEAGVKIAR